MLALLRGLVDALRDALPTLGSAIVALLAFLLYRANRKISQSRTKNIAQSEDAANAGTEAAIASLEAKVKADDEDRLKVEAALTDSGVPVADTKPRR